MDLEVIANILNTGVTGFAFLMLFLGFRLTYVDQYWHIL